MSVVEAAKQLYENELRRKLEPDCHGKYLAIEPETKAYFLGDSFIAVALAARDACHGKKTFVLRIGHDAAFHIGGLT